MSETIKGTVIGALITGAIGLAGTVSAAFIGNSIGKSTEQKNIQNQMNEVMGDMVNIIGDGNEVTINDIKEVLEDYLDLKTQHESLLAQNTKYFDDLNKANEEIDKLHTLASEEPSINFTNLAMSIDGEDIQVNKNNSMVTIDGRDYISKELFEKIVPDNKNITIKDNTLYVGQVIAEKAKLSQQHIKENLRCSLQDSVKDSFGYTHNDCIILDGGIYGSSEIEFSLQNKYDMLKCSLSILCDSTGEKSSTITIKSDGNVIYSVEVTQDTETIPIELAINKCTVLAFSKDGSDYFDCIISDAMVYN